MGTTGKHPASGAGKPSLYQEVTDRIIAELEQGRVPWVQPWGRAKAGLGLPRNAATGRRYSGVNILILWGAERFGPVVSGVLLSMPVTGSIMPPFTLALYGADAVARVTRGFIVGLSGFTAFFFVIAAGAVSLGIAGGFFAAIVAALVTSTIASRVLKVEAIEEAGVN